MTVVFLNTAAVLIGSVIGLLCKKGIPQKLVDTVMLGIGLCTLYIGISGALAGENTLVLILSMVVGSLIGTALDLEGKIGAFGNYLGRRFAKQAGGSNVAQAFLTGGLLFCVGAMTIVGALNVGLAGDGEMLYTKSVMDLISSMMLAASLGVGILFSSAFVLVFEGALVLLSQVLAPILVQSVIVEITCVGSVLIIALALNILGITKIKVSNYLPAIVVAPPVWWLMDKVMALL